MPELKPAYLIWGDDEAKFDAWRRRVRERVDEEGSGASLEVLAGERLAPDAVCEAIAALTLGTGRRYVLADGVERWKDSDAKQVEAALEAIPPDTVVVLIAVGEPQKRLIKAVQSSGGQVTEAKGPSSGGYPRWLAEQSRELGFELDADAANLLLSLIGQDQRRLLRELEKLAVFAGDERRVAVGDVEALTGSAIEARVYELGDAVVEGDCERALRIAEQLQAQEEEMMHIIFALLRQLRQAHRTWAVVAGGGSARDVQSAVRVPPWIAKRLVAQARQVDGERLEHAIALLADLDFSIRGAGSLDAHSALTKMLAEATGGVEAALVRR